MKIWVDADACPGDIKDIIVRAANRLSIDTVFVANKDIRVPRTPFVTTVRVGMGPDVADAYIADAAVEGDVVITQDIPLAAIVVPKNIVAIDPRGDLFNMENIRERLSIRDFMQSVRDAGVITGGPKSFDQKAKQRFAATFDKVLAQLIRQRS